VSRQIADLARRGLVDRSRDPAGGRGQMLTVTPAGAALLEEATRRQRAELDRRLADRTPAEAAEFAPPLRRYNGD
jgi:DNA-binding MarR family transcriptional regulator